MPVFRQLRLPVAQAKIEVVIVQVVCGYFFPFLDGHHRSAGKCEVILCKADCVGCAGMVEDGGDGEQSLQVNILVRVFTNNVSIRINYS